MSKKLKTVHIVEVVVSHVGTFRDACLPWVLDHPACTALVMLLSSAAHRQRFIAEGLKGIGSSLPLGGGGGGGGGPNFMGMGGSNMGSE